MELVLDREFDFITYEIHNMNFDNLEKREVLFTLQLLLRKLGYLKEDTKKSFLMNIYFKTKSFYFSI